MRPYTFLLLCLLPATSIAQQYGGYDYGRDPKISYIEVFVTYRTYGLFWRHLTDPRVYVDYGQGRLPGSHPPLISADSTGQSVYFFSPTQALNWFSGHGWRLDQYRSTAYERYMLLTKLPQNRHSVATQEPESAED